MTLLESPAPWTQAVRIRDAPSSSGGCGGRDRVFLNTEWAVLERRRLYCDSEREIDMVTIEKPPMPVGAVRRSQSRASSNGATPLPGSAQLISWSVAMRVNDAVYFFDSTA